MKLKLAPFHPDPQFSGLVLCKIGPVEDSRGGAENAEEHLLHSSPSAPPAPPRETLFPQSLLHQAFTGEL